jgi:hypothetical protein
VSIGDRIELVLLVLSSMILGLLELFFLPLRFDGTTLPDLGAWPFPVTALVALLTLPLLTRRAGQLSTRLGVAGAPAGAWLLTIFVLCFAGPGSDLLMLPDWRTLLLVGGGVVVSAYALGRVLGDEIRSR